MKTNREILKQFNIEPSDFLDPNDYLKVEAAMNERASQALDEAADKAKAVAMGYLVDKDSILDIKKSLK